MDVTVATAGGTSPDVAGDKFNFEYFTPIVSNVAPSNGSAAGGTIVTITGQYFLSTQQVYFGSTPAISFQVVSDTKVTAVSPPSASGARVDVTVLSEGLQSATSAADEFTYAASAPDVTGVSPSSGPVGGGSTVIITGSNLLGATAVKFGGVAGTIVPGTDTGGQLEAISPAGAAGTVDITVVAASGASTPSSGDEFTYFVPVSGPVVTGLSPSSGPVDMQTEVTIFGSRLSNPTAVKFGGVAAQILNSSDSQIVVVDPGLATPGPVDVTVTTAAGTSAAVAADQFTYYGTAPTILGLVRFGGGDGSIAPANNSFEWTIAIDGANLAGASEVDFGGVQVTTFARDTATEIDVDVPEEGPGTVPVTVKTPSGTSNAVSLTYTAAPDVVQVFSIDESGSTADGPLIGGTSVTIRGIDIGNATAVDFGNTPVTNFTFTPDPDDPSDGQITVASPPSIAGVVDVTVVSAAGTSQDVPPDEFTYLPIPTITGINPAAGPLAGGNLVTISGSGFSGNEIDVNFGGVVTGGSSPDGNTLYVDAPAGVSLGAVNVSVTTDGGATPSSVPYIYDPPPVVSGLSRTSGAIRGGTPVTISGSRLIGVTAVDFGDAPADLSTLTYNADGTITVDSPSSPYYGSSGSPDGTGTVDVTVTTYDGTSADNPPNDQFTYNHDPFITQVQGPIEINGTQAAGFATSGDMVTIYGDDLSNVTAINFGNIPADLSTLIYNNGGSITVDSPAAPSGTLDITVTTAIGPSDISPADQFTYGAAPTVTGISPATGSTDGFTQVTITGTGLANAEVVGFGGNGVAISSDTDNQIVVTSPPALAAGAVDVTVGTPFGISTTSAADLFTYKLPPQINSQDVLSGPVAGGTRVTLTGSDLSNATVDFGSNPGTIVSDTDGVIVVQSPKASNDSPGTVSLTVTTAYGSSTEFAGDHEFTYALAADVTAISPSFGPTAGGTTVTISGDNLFGTMAVDFGGIPASSFSVNADGTISAVSPAGEVATVDVTVVTLGGTTATSPADQFTYLAAPTIISISPTAGPEAGGTAVTIVGTGLADATEVDFGGVATAGFTLNPDGTITATSPDLSLVGAVDVTVVSPEGTSVLSSVDQFTYQATPTVTSVSPSLGNTLGGDIVTIVGSNLDGALAVDFGQNAGRMIIFDSPGEIQVVSPAGVAGSVDVTVVGPGGTSATSSADQFIYVGAPSATADSYSVTAGSTLTVDAASGVLANDTDPQHLPLTAELLAGPTNGTLSLSSDGSFTYTPNDGFVGTDSFIYQADNGNYVSSPTVVSLTIVPYNPLLSVVTNTLDSGPGSLRQAMLDATADTSGQQYTIQFALPSGPQTINLQSPLSTPTDPVLCVIDATQNVTLELAGSVAELTAGVNIMNSSTATAGIIVSGSNQVVGAISGSGNVVVGDGSDLTANSIQQNSLVIGGTASSPAMVTIAASDSSGNPLISAAAAPSSNGSVSALSNSVAGNAGTEATLAERLAAIRAQHLAQQLAASPASTGDDNASSGVAVPPVIGSTLVPTAAAIQKVISTAAGVSPMVYVRAMVHVDVNIKPAAISTVVSGSLGAPVGEGSISIPLADPNVATSSVASQTSSGTLQGAAATHTILDADAVSAAFGSDNWEWLGSDPVAGSTYYSLDDVGGLLLGDDLLEAIGKKWGN